MSHNHRVRRPLEPEFQAPPETSYLVEDVTELVNERFDAFLDGAPFHIKAKNFHPELIGWHGLPDGIHNLGEKYLPPLPTPREFTGIDLLFRFPIDKTVENPFNITVNWSDNRDVRLAIVDKRPVILAEESGDNGDILYAERTHPEVMEYLLESLGLPESFWGDDVKEITRDLYNCPDLFITRSAKTRVDLATTLEIVHDARMTHDMDDKKQLIQELCINVDHESADAPVPAGHLYLPPYAKYRNMLRFERTDDNSAWKFAGAYHGRLGMGDLIDEIVQVDPKLGIPNGKVLDKALTILSQVERAK